MKNCRLNYLSFSFLFIVIFLVSGNSSQIISLVGTSKLTTDTQNFVNANNLKSLGISKVQKTASENFYSDKNVTFITQMLSSNGDISASFQKFQGAIYKKKVLKTSDYRMTYSLMGNVFSSSPISDYQKAELGSKNVMIDCDYRIYSPLSKFEAVRFTPQYKNIKFYLTKIFGVDESNKLVLINNYTNSSQNPYIEDITTNAQADFLNSYEDYHVVKSVTDSKGYLLIKQTNNKYCILEIIFKDSPHKGDITLYIIVCKEINTISTYYNATVNGDNIYISSNNGIEIYSIKTLNYIGKVDNSDGWISIVMVGDYLFGILKNFGLKIYRYWNGMYLSMSTFRHPKLKTMEYYINPFYGYKFLGLLVDRTDYIGMTNITDGNEFFIELYLPANDVSSPKINKIYTQSDNAVNQMIAMDYFYLYFYDANKKEIILIRRGLFNSIPSVSYILPTYAHFRENSILVPIQNTTTGYMGPAVVTENLFIYPLSFSFRNHYMECTMKEGGLYTLVFIQKTDACQNSITEKVKEYYCYRQIKYNFQIYGDYSDPRNKWIGIGIGIGVLIIIVAIVFWIYKYNKGFSNNRLRLVRIDKDDRKKLYMEDSEDFNFAQKPLKEEKDYDENENHNEIRVDTQDQSEMKKKKDDYLATEENMKRIQYGEIQEKEEGIIYKINNQPNRNRKKLAPIKHIEGNLLVINRVTNHNEDTIRISNNENDNLKSTLGK